MTRIDKVTDRLGFYFAEYYNLIVLIFLCFFVVEAFHIKNEINRNADMINSLDNHAIELNESIDEIMVNTMEASKRKASFKEFVEDVMPYSQLFDSYLINKGDLSDFISTIKSDLLSVRNDRYKDFFDDSSDLLELSVRYPKLEGYVLSRARLEFAMRTYSYIGIGSCCMFSPRPFTIMEVVGDQYHFYPNNFRIPSCDGYVKVNGELLTEDYMWRPTRRGMHYFDIEIFNTSYFKTKRKKFRLGLKVV